MVDWCEYWRGPGSGPRECDSCGIVGEACAPTRALKPDLCVWWQRARAERAEKALADYQRVVRDLVGKPVPQGIDRTSTSQAEV